MKKIDPTPLSRTHQPQDAEKPKISGLRPHRLPVEQAKTDGIITDLRPKLSPQEAALLAGGLLNTLNDGRRSLEAQGKGLTESRVLELLSEEG